MCEAGFHEPAFFLVKGEFLWYILHLDYSEGAGE